MERTKFLHLMSLITKNNPQSLQCISFLNLALYEIYFQSFLSNDCNLVSHYASANQNEFKINAEIIDYDPSKKIILLDGDIHDLWWFSNIWNNCNDFHEWRSNFIEGNPARINLENPEKFWRSKTNKIYPGKRNIISGWGSS